MGAWDRCKRLLATTPREERVCDKVVPAMVTYFLFQVSKCFELIDFVNCELTEPNCTLHTVRGGGRFVTE